MKRIFRIIIVILIFFLISGCNPFSIAGIVLEGVATVAKPSSSSSEKKQGKTIIYNNTVLTNELDSFQIGNYIVKVNEGYFGKEPHIYWSVYNGNKLVVQGLSQNETEVNEYIQTDDKEKIALIKKRFLKANIVLDPGNAAIVRISGPNPQSSKKDIKAECSEMFKFGDKTVGVIKSNKMQTYVAFDGDDKYLTCTTNKYYVKEYENMNQDQKKDFIHQQFEKIGFDF